jgi:hypothetical protein
VLEVLEQLLDRLLPLLVEHPRTFFHGIGGAVERRVASLSW